MGESADSSGAATAGNIGAAAASFGLGGAGGAGGLIQGAAAQGGKIIQGIANVVSSTLVGSVPGSFMTTPEAYGRTLRPEQRQPATAPNRVTNYNESANYELTRAFQELDLRENIEQQSQFASLPGRI